MRKLILFFLLSLICFHHLIAEENKRTFDIEKFRANRMEFLTKEVSLTVEEAAQLFPLYNEMQSKRYNSMKLTKIKAKELRKNANATNEDLSKMVDELLDKQSEDAAIEKAYYQRFKKIISPQKLLKLKLADNHYSREMLKNRDQFFIKPNLIK